VRSAYLGRYGRDGASGPDPQGAEGQFDLHAAVAALLGYGIEAERRLIDEINKMFTNLTESWNSHLVLNDKDTTIVQEWHDKNGDIPSSNWRGGFHTCLALAWLLRIRKQEKLPEIPKPPTDFSHWPRPVVPRQIVRAAKQGKLPVPLGEVRHGTLPDDDADLFADPPPKPADDDPRLQPPAAVTNVWQLSVVQDLPLPFRVIEQTSSPLNAPTFDFAAHPGYILTYSRVASTGNTDNLVAIADEARIEEGKLILHLKINCNLPFQEPAHLEVEYRFGWVLGQI
jgi:hypothetical protein